MEPLTSDQRQTIVDNDEQFKLYVMEVLGEVQAGMKSLVGNGQPGRVSKLEAKVDRLEWYLALAIGGSVAAGFILQWVWKIGCAYFHIS
jgi:hypothetical protein